LGNRFTWTLSKKAPAILPGLIALWWFMP